LAVVISDLPTCPKYAGDVADEQGDDGHDDQKLEEGENRSEREGEVGRKGSYSGQTG